jgi:hypothetical protein
VEEPEPVILVIAAVTLRDMLQAVADGSDPDWVYLEMFNESIHVEGDIE